MILFSCKLSIQFFHEEYQFPYLKIAYKEGCKPMLLGGKRSCTNLKWAWNGSGLQLLAP